MTSAPTEPRPAVFDADVQIAVLVPLRLQPGQRRDRHLVHTYTQVRRLYGALGPRVAVLVGQQSWDGHKFARGRCLNALALLALAWYPGVQRFVLHDVDLIPDAACVAQFAAPLPYEGQGVLALNGFGQYKGCADYIGGICVVSRATFVGANGFDQRFEGWGGEDDALRNAIVAYVSEGAAHELCAADLIYKHPAGAGVVDLEVAEREAAAREGTAPPARCADTPAWKMDTKEKRAVVSAARQERFKTHGLSSAQFAIADIFRWSGTLTPTAGSAADAAAAPPSANAAAGFVDFVIVTLELYVTLPPGWHMCVSKTCGWPYYYDMATRTSMYEVPVGTTVAREAPPPGALRLASTPDMADDGSDTVDGGTVALQAASKRSCKRGRSTQSTQRSHAKASAPIARSPTSAPGAAAGGAGLSRLMTPSPAAVAAAAAAAAAAAK